MKGHTFISAHFCNDKRTLVEALWEKDGKSVVQYIEANDNSKRLPKMIAANRCLPWDFSPSSPFLEFRRLSRSNETACNELLEFFG